MIVKFEDEQGGSFFDFVIHVSKLNDEAIVRLTRATMDHGEHNLITNEFNHGSLMILSDRAAIIGQYDLGPDPGPKPEGETK